jgi:hypothetical protein
MDTPLYPQQRRRIVLLSALLQALVLNHAAAQNPPVLTPETKLVTQGAKVPVSGGIRVGLQTAGRGSFPEGTPTAIVTLPDRAARPPAASWLCLEISAQDGRYAVRFGYRLPPTAQGPTTLQLSRPEIDRLRTYALEDLALLAAISSDCATSEPSAFLLSRWKAPTPSDEFVLLLNSRVPTTIRRQPALNGDPPLSCVPKDGDAVSFNLRCTVPAAWLDSDSTFLIQQRRGRSVANIDMPVRKR